MNLQNRLKKFNFKRDYPVIIFFILFLLALQIRWRTLYDFCFLFTDSDQLVLWLAAHDMHMGIFHEPCFYGEAYNPLFEPLFAQPLIALGMAYRIALPLVSGLLGFLPYALLAWFLFREKYYISAAFAFAYLLWLPIEFQVITSIPRGFVPATAFAAIGVSIGLFTRIESRFFWFAFLCALATFTSENSLFLSFPAAVYLLLQEYKNKRFYIASLLGFLASLPLPLFIHWFYSTHPEYNLHLLELNFDYDTFLTTLKNTDTWFNFLTPIHGYKLAVLVCFYLIPMILCLLKRNFKSAISIFAGLALFIFSLSLDKTQDGSESLFFSSVRMFLGVPVSFILFCSWVENSFESAWEFHNIRQYILSSLLIIAIIFSINRNSTFRSSLYKYSRYPDVVVEDWVSQTKEFCDKIMKQCRDNHTNVVIFDNWMVHVNYMMAVFDYPVTTLIPSYDRRTWLLQSMENFRPANFLYLPIDSDKVKDIPAEITWHKVNDTSAFLIECRGARIFDILHKMKVEIRHH